MRESLLDAGERLIHEHGYNGVGVKEIVDTAGVPKGSFYSYFDSKEALVVEVVQRYWDAVEARHGALLEDEARRRWSGSARSSLPWPMTTSCSTSRRAVSWEAWRSSLELEPRHAHDAHRPLRPLGGTDRRDACARTGAG